MEKLEYVIPTDGSSTFIERSITEQQRTVDREMLLRHLGQGMESAPFPALHTFSIGDVRMRAGAMRYNAQTLTLTYFGVTHYFEMTCRIQVAEKAVGGDRLALIAPSFYSRTAPIAKRIPWSHPSVYWLWVVRIVWNQNEFCWQNERMALAWANYGNGGVPDISNLRLPPIPNVHNTGQICTNARGSSNQSATVLIQNNIDTCLNSIWGQDLYTEADAKQDYLWRWSMAMTKDAKIDNLKFKECDLDMAVTQGPDWSSLRPARPEFVSEVKQLAAFLAR